MIPILMAYFTIATRSWIPSFLIIQIITIVASAFGEPVARLIQKQGRNNTAKKLPFYLMKRYAGLDNREIGQVFGGIHYLRPVIARISQVAFGMTCLPFALGKKYPNAGCEWGGNTCFPLRRDVKLPILVGLPGITYMSL
jgi:hypothetical protein